MHENQYLLIVEDNLLVARSLVDLLESYSYQARAVHTGHDALNMLEDRPPHLVLLDITLPDINGFEVLRRIRQYSNVPVVILSARSRDTDKVRGLEAGADDYITKPFFEEELLARISALLRRVNWTSRGETVLEVGQLRVDITRRQVTLRGKSLHLTPIEYAILCTLMQRSGEIVSHDDLLESVWGPGYQGDFSVLRVNISRLRQKIEEQPNRPSYILTVPRQGYQMPARAKV